MGRSVTLARLSLDTARAYGALEEALLGPLDFPTASGYRRFLCLLYGFHSPLEAALALTPGIELDHIAPRVKSPRIASDLLSLGLTGQEFGLLARRQSIDAFANTAQAYGFMYATERMMLQVEALRTRLECETPVLLALANQFIYSYANIADLRWRQYGALLDRTAQRYELDTREITEGAKRGITSFLDWVAMHRPVRHERSEALEPALRPSAQSL
ncbi:MAG TPA: hypothetical protein VK427_23045 [Kofleriaceae bacterium]|nr:hypothetical protein [Kofleriaceae bacterium]